MLARAFAGARVPDHERRHDPESAPRRGVEAGSMPAHSSSVSASCGSMPGDRRPPACGPWSLPAGSLRCRLAPRLWRFPQRGATPESWAARFSCGQSLSHFDMANPSTAERDRPAAGAMVREVGRPVIAQCFALTPSLPTALVRGLSFGGSPHTRPAIGCARRACFAPS
jgi:hypothetical protein